MKKGVTVVVITKDRPLALSALLASLHSQSLPTFELILVLNGDRSWNPYLDKILIALRVRGVSVTVCECVGMGYGKLHDHAYKLVQTDFVCRVDDDQILDPKYLENLRDELEKDSSIGAVGGIVLHPEYKETDFMKEEFSGALQKALASGILNTIFQLKRHPGTKPLRVTDLYSSFMARTNVVNQIGGIATCYDSCGYREESDLTLRVAFAGYKLYVIPTAIIWHIRAEEGGERRSGEIWEKIKQKNETMFRSRLKSWCDNPIANLAHIWEEGLRENG